MHFEQQIRKKVKKNCQGKDFVIFMEDHAVRKGADQEKTEVWFWIYNWESTQPELTEKEKEKIQFKTLQKEESRILSEPGEKIPAVVTAIMGTATPDEEEDGEETEQRDKEEPSKQEPNNDNCDELMEVDTITTKNNE